MNFEVLQAAWQSGANSPSKAASVYMLHEAATALKRRRLEVGGLIAFAGVMLTIPLALIGVDVLTGQVDAIDVAREWALIPFALIPFAVLVLVARRHKTHMERHVAAGATILSAFRALLDENAAARFRTHLIGGAIVIFAPLILLLLHQLGETGKMAPQHMVQAGAVMGGALALSLIVMAVRYFTRLVPERRRLEALIASYEVTADA
ncbi:MAG: hypothetical protein K8S25_09505 [Alphaproteobacteria bacterium]|nr:hypothetical protein [Alphaproteobacteria bacterium]